MKINLRWIICVKAIYVLHICDCRCIKHSEKFNISDIVLNDCDASEKNADISIETPENTVDLTPTKIEGYIEQIHYKDEITANTTFQEAKEKYDFDFEQLINDPNFEEIIHQSDSLEKENYDYKLDDTSTTDPTFDEIKRSSDSHIYKTKEPFDYYDSTIDPALSFDNEKWTYTTALYEEEPYFTTEYEETDQDYNTFLADSVTQITIIHISDHNEDDVADGETETPLDFEINPIDFFSFVNGFITPDNRTNVINNSSNESTTVSAMYAKPNNDDVTEVLKEVAIVIGCAAAGSLFVLYVAYRLRNCVQRDYNLPESDSVDTTV